MGVAGHRPLTTAGPAGAGAAGRPSTARVLVLNAGSSTLKASVVAADRPGDAPQPPVAGLTINWGNDATKGADVQAGVATVLAQLAEQGLEPGDLAAVAHRVVHGGEAFREPALVDEALLAVIVALGPLAPLHNPVAAATIRAAQAALPGLAHVAVFDTAFHATLPEAAWRYPLPAEWEGWGLRRYGFHGLSVAWSVERAATLLGRPARKLNLVVAHLGSGCSVTAVAGGRSLATSMGMTPLEGLMMGTRAGSIDPGIILAVLRDQRRTAAELADDLNHLAGLLGVSGRSAGMRELEAAATGGDQRAALAIEMFVDRTAAGIAAASTALTGLDALVFTGGIGENSGAVRARIVERLAVLGLLPIDDTGPGGDRRLDQGSAGRAILRVAAREDVVAARAAWRIAGRIRPRAPGQPLVAWLGVSGPPRGG